MAMSNTSFGPIVSPAGSGMGNAAPRSAPVHRPAAPKTGALRQAMRPIGMAEGGHVAKPKGGANKPQASLSEGHHVEIKAKLAPHHFGRLVGALALAALMRHRRQQMAQRGALQQAQR